MFESEGLKRLLETKQLLQMQSELLRQSLRVEIAEVWAPRSWAGSVGDLSRRLSPAIWWAAPLAGFIVAWRWPSARKLLFKALTVWQFARRWV